MSMYTFSLLDRLFDDHPDEVIEKPSATERNFYNLKELVSRDVENLLNTRCDLAIDFACYPELKRSVLTYGLPDFSHMSPNNPADRQYVSTAVADIITRFEPRLAHVDIELGDTLTSRDGHGFVFKINALLLTDPEPENVVFDATLDIATQLYQIAS